MRFQWLVMLLASASLGCVAWHGGRCDDCGPGGPGGLGPHGRRGHHGRGGPGADPYTRLPPSQMLMQPGPGVGGPGPGVIPPPGMGPGGPGGVPAIPGKSQLAFVGPDGVQVQWKANPMSPEPFDSEPLVAPGRQTFMQGNIYRLKLSAIPDREGVELFPTIEVAPALPRTAAFIEHSTIPIQFTPEDFDQVLTGNFVTKVIYLPDPEFQELAIAGVETLVSTRLDPGVDPIVEADRRGAILAIVRIGNKDITAEGAGDMAAVAGGFAGGPPGYPPGPQWGMPITGTPIGLPGPPHIPLGVPAGLQRHSIKNNTNVHMPAPTENMRIIVKDQPGYSYPAPVDTIRVREYGN